MKFGDGLGRNNDVRLLAARNFQFDIGHCQPPSIRRHECELVLLQTKQETVEHVARFIGRDRVGSSAQTVAQIFLPDCDHLGIFEFRKGREFFFRQSEDLEITLAAANGSGVFSIDIDLDFTRRKLAHDVEEPARRKRGRPFLFHFRFKTSTNANVQVCRRQLNFAIACLQQDVGKNRQRGARANDILDLLQTFEELFFCSTELHDDNSA